jgi:hypothetical protein
VAEEHIHDDGQCDDGGLKLETAAVAAEAVVERKDAVRWTRPLLSELQLWQKLSVAVDRRQWRNLSKGLNIYLVYRHKKLPFCAEIPR